MEPPVFSFGIDLYFFPKVRLICLPVENQNYWKV
jgi:hypothetical protein